jgi:hypothetical protein
MGWRDKMVHSEYEEFEKLVLILEKKGIISEEEANLIFGDDSLEEANYL